jgi:hypothetical protein
LGVTRAEKVVFPERFAPEVVLLRELRDYLELFGIKTSA